MASDYILNSPIFRDYILPFVLVFAVIFAILERSNILGEGKKQINAMVGLVVGLLLISFEHSRDIIVKLMPILAVMVVILLIFMIIYGFAKQEKEIKLPQAAITWIFIIAITVVVVALMKITGVWEPFINYTKTEKGEVIFANIILIAAIVTAMIGVWNLKGNK